MGKVWELDIPAEQQTVLLALADHAHDDGTSSHPGVRYLAWKVGMSERTVQRVLAVLRDRSIINPVANATGGRGRPTVYFIDIDQAPKKEPFVYERASTVSPFTGTQRVTEETPFTGTKGDRLSPFKRVTGVQRVTESTIKGDKNELKGDSHARARSNREPEEPEEPSGGEGPESKYAPVFRQLQTFPDFRPGDGFWQTVEKKYDGLDLVEEIEKMSGWIRAQRKRKMTSAFVLGWLSRVGSDNGRGSSNGHAGQQRMGANHGRPAPDDRLSAFDKFA